MSDDAIMQVGDYYVSRQADLPGQSARDIVQTE